MVGEENMATEHTPIPHGPRLRFKMHRTASTPVDGVSPVAPESKKIPTKKAAVARLAGVILAITAANAGVATKYHMDYDVPLTPTGITEDVIHIPQEWVVLGIQAKDALSKIGEKEKPILPTFENKTVNQVVQAGINAAPVTENDLASITTDIVKSSLPDKQPTLNNLIFPVMLEPGDRIDITKKQGGGGGGAFDTNTGKTVNLPAVTGGYDFLIPRKGTQLTAGLLDKQAKTIEVFKLPPYIVRGMPYFHGIVIIVTRNDGYKYQVSLTSPEDVRFLKPLPILDDAPTLEEELIIKGNSTRLTWKNKDQRGKIISGTTSILETGRANASVSYDLNIGGLFEEYATFGFNDISFAADSNNRLKFIPQPQK